MELSGSAHFQSTYNPLEENMNINFPLVLVDKYGTVLAKVHNQKDVIVNTKNNVMYSCVNSGVAIPSPLTPHFGNKNIVNETDPQFAEAFCTVLYDKVLYRLDCRWKNTSKNSHLTDKEIYKMVKKLFDKSSQSFRC